MEFKVGTAVQCVHIPILLNTVVDVHVFPHLSIHMNFSTFCCIIGSRVAAAGWSGTALTTPKAGVTDVSTISITYPVGICWGSIVLNTHSPYKPNALTSSYKSDSSIWMTTTGPSSNTGVCSSLVDHEHVHFTKPPVNANYCFMSHFSLFLGIFMGYSHTHRYIRVHISLNSPSLQL